VSDPRHLSVLPAETVAAFAPLAGRTIVDATFGAGGHSRLLLQAGAAKVYGIDRDPNAQASGAALEAEHSGRFTFIRGRFGDIADLLPEPVDGVLADIGVSSMQLDQADYGMSFRFDAPLDARMDPTSGESAAELIARLEHGPLAKLLRDYGEEPRAGRVASAIVAARAKAPVATTSQLADIVRKALGGAHGPKDPATRTFQALRIAVNDELGELERLLRGAEAVLRPGGRLAVITFHSLEDRIVKLFLRARSGATPAQSRHLPDTRGTGPASSFCDVAKPVRASDAELAANPRARSATLRAATRTAAPCWKDR
jgi:16S rRNA (cytosine1402-N4)-methyltransferase